MIWIDGACQYTEKYYPYFFMFDLSENRPILHLWSHDKGPNLSNTDVDYVNFK